MRLAARAVHLMVLGQQQILVAAALGIILLGMLGLLVLLLFDIQALIQQQHLQPDLPQLLLVVVIVTIRLPETVQLRSEAQHGSFCKT
jgi:hypothetical protein